MVLSRCAVTTGNSIRCWGKNDKGSIGNSSTINVSNPTHARVGLNFIIKNNYKN